MGMDSSMLAVLQQLGNFYSLNDSTGELVYHTNVAQYHFNGHN